MQRLHYCFFLCFIVLIFVACKERKHKHIGEKQIVAQPAQINKLATEIIQQSLTDLLEDNSHIAELPSLKNTSILKDIYKANDYLPLWTNNGAWIEAGDSLFHFINEARYYGLFPQDYYVQQLTDLHHKLVEDTVMENKLDASLWAETDLYLSAAFVQIVKDLKNGRILQDSIDRVKDSLLGSDFIYAQLKSFKENASIAGFTDRIEPRHSWYKSLRNALKTFVPSADFRTYTYVHPKDSLNLLTKVKERLNEEDSIDIDVTADSVALSTAIKKYQKLKGLKVDGKFSAALIDRLNDTDAEKFIRLAITLDRYKQLPDSMPSQYIWVNIPAYQMYVKENDTVRLSSRVVVGKPHTRTPVLTSSITDMITYPQWTIPASIIKKEILPGLKKDPGYTIKKGFSLIDKDGNVIDPYFVDWSRFETGIPYKVVQGSGDDNALGVIKFNFSNKHSVYLHDTNQRSLFSKKSRALSHGCVRVQKWDSLAYYILRNDSIYSDHALPADSLQRWLSLKEKHVIPVRKRIPLFIRYFTCEAKDDQIVFYEDVYGDDRRIKQKFFNKN